MATSREDQSRITVKVNDIDCGPFDRVSGRNLDSEESKYRPGGMAPELSLGGRQSNDNITVARMFNPDTDRALVGQLEPLRGKGSGVVTEQPLDLDRNPVGAPFVQTGTLKRVGLPDRNSMSNDPAMFELEFTANSQLG